MIKTKIKIDVPFDELCDSCDYIKYESGIALCSVFFEQLDKNYEDQYIPCSVCISRRG